jgi:hypothetical protein
MKSQQATGLQGEPSKVIVTRNYERASDGSTLKLLKEPSRMTDGQIGQWAQFNTGGQRW